MSEYERNGCNTDSIHFYAMCDSACYRSKEKAKQEFGLIKTRLKTYRFTKESLCRALKAGHAVCGSVLVGGTKDANFNAGQLIGVDFDNAESIRDERGKVIEERKIEPGEPGYMYRALALARCRDYGVYPVCVYSTLRESRDWVKFRMLFLLNEQIDECSTIRSAIAGLLQIFPEADQACKDASRVFLGSNGEVFETYKSRFWQPCDVDLFTVHAPKSETPSRPRKAGILPRRVRKPIVRGRHIKIEELKRSFDLLSLMGESAGAIARNSEEYAQFVECPICGHHGCLTYYKKSNSYYCFSKDHDRGGSVIDWVMELHDIQFQEAIEMLGVCDG